VQFLQIHPFQDGNGRLSRILTNLLLLKEGYLHVPYISHEKIIEDNKPDYYLALRNSQKTFNTEKESITDWLVFFLRIFLKQSQMAIDLLSNEDLIKTLSTKQLAVWNYLSEVKEATPLEISQNTGVARPTINQIANKLLKLRKIEKTGLGRSIKYKIV